MKWTVTLKGDAWDLKALTGLGVGVTEEGHAFVLRSPDLESIAVGRPGFAVPGRVLGGA